MNAIAPSDARRFLAEEIRVTANIRSPGVIDALATVPRERFLPPGPWEIRGTGDAGGTPRRTEDADPTRVYHDVSVAIDPARNLFNGQPSLIARWLDDLQLAPGQRVVHIGCGTGYFTALIAHVVGPTGHVAAIEVDEELADRARVNLCRHPWVHVRPGNGTTGLPSDVDAILVHAGATHVLDMWLDALTDRGRLLVPLTVEFPGMPTGIGKGMTLLVTRSGSEWQARALGAMPVAIYSLRDIRDPGRGPQLMQAMTTGGLLKVMRRRRDKHDLEASCVVHGRGSCLSA